MRASLIIVIGVASEYAPEVTFAQYGVSVQTEGVTELPPTKKVVSRTERSPAWMITVGKSDAEVCISCQQRLE